VVVDNLRILSLGLTRFGRPTFQAVAASFAVAAPFYAYQILLNLNFRVGQLKGVAWRLYGYVFCSGLFAVVALVAGSFDLYLLLLALSEILLSAAFMWLALNPWERRSLAGRRGFISACFAALLVVALSAWVRSGSSIVFVTVSPRAVAWSSFWLLMTMGLLTVFSVTGNADLWRAMVTNNRTRDEQPVAAGCVVSSGQEDLSAHLSLVDSGPEECSLASHAQVVD
jgi:hypothetical protein